ncbi:MAG: hypothetical protein PUD26_05665 [bacterium]|nr:hypothetical protein [bacterium]MDD6026073.1 hypothetical protein [bacterium]
MFIIKALVFIFLLFIALVFFGILRIAFNAKSYMRRFSDIFGSDDTNQDDDRKEREKVFGDNDGEYVEFEEVTGEARPNDDSDRKTAADYRAMIKGDEGQVSDADYEEIK